MPAPLAAPNATPRTARGGRKRKGEKEKGGGGSATRQGGDTHRLHKKPFDPHPTCLQSAFCASRWKN